MTRSSRFVCGAVRSRILSGYVMKFEKMDIINITN